MTETVSLRSRILEADDIGKKLVHVPEWDVDVEIRTMTAGKRSEMMKSATDDDGNIDVAQLWPMIIIASAYDPETNEALFTSDDIDALKEKSAAAVEMLGSEAMSMSGMGGDDPVDEAGKAS